MSAHPGQPPLLKRLSPGRWTALVWAGAMGFAFVDEFLVLPGDSARDDKAASAFAPTLVSWPILLAAVALVPVSCRLMERRPLTSYALLLLGSALGAALLGQAAEFPLVQFLAPDVALYFIAAATPRRGSARAAGMAFVVLVIPLTVRLYGAAPSIPPGNSPWPSRCWSPGCSATPPTSPGSTPSRSEPRQPLRP